MHELIICIKRSSEQICYFHLIHERRICWRQDMSKVKIFQQFYVMEIRYKMAKNTLRGVQRRNEVFLPHWVTVLKNIFNRKYRGSIWIAQIQFVLQITSWWTWISIITYLSLLATKLTKCSMCLTWSLEWWKESTETQFKQLASHTSKYSILDLS